MPDKGKVKGGGREIYQLGDVKTIESGGNYYWGRQHDKFTVQFKSSHLYAIIRSIPILKHETLAIVA